MKKLLLFLTLLSISHLSYGAEVSQQTKDNLWDVLANPHKETVQNMTPQQALDAYKQEDPLFSFDTFILTARTATQNTLLHLAVHKNNLEHVKFIFENITDSTKSTLAFMENKNKQTPFTLASQQIQPDIINYMLSNIGDTTQESLVYSNGDIEEYKIPLLTLMLQNESFNPNNPYYFKTASQPHAGFLSKVITRIINDDNHSFKQPLIQLIQTNKCKSLTLAKMLLTCLEAIHNKKSNLESYSVNEYEDLINAITTNKNFDKDTTLNLFIRQNEYSLPAIKWLFERFPDYQFADDTYINYIVGKHEDWNSISDQSLALIQLLVDRKITSIPLKKYNVLKHILKQPQRSSFDLNQLTINSWTRGRSLGLKTIGIATILYDFMTFKKPAKVTDDKKESKAKTTEKAGVKKETKKAAINQDTKESKEKQKRSLIKRLTKHTRNYVKDLKNLRNHKKLAIPVACVLVRLLKDKTPLKWI
jgi:hypothetical protein